MQKKELIAALMETPNKLGAGLQKYHQAKRQVEQLEGQRNDLTDWSTVGPPVNKSKKYKEVEKQLAEAKVGVDTAEEELAVLQAQLEVCKILARASLYTDD